MGQRIKRYSRGSCPGWDGNRFFTIMPKKKKGGKVEREESRDLGDTQFVQADSQLKDYWLLQRKRKRLLVQMGGQEKGEGKYLQRHRRKPESSPQPRRRVSGKKGCKAKRRRLRKKGEPSNVRKDGLWGAPITVVDGEGYDD